MEYTTDTSSLLFLSTNITINRIIFIITIVVTVVVVLCFVKILHHDDSNPKSPDYQRSKLSFLLNFRICIRSTLRLQFKYQRHSQTSKPLTCYVSRNIKTFVSTIVLLCFNPSLELKRQKKKKKKKRNDKLRNHWYYYLPYLYDSDH